jgi:hypothetical protein
MVSQGFFSNHFIMTIVDLFISASVLYIWAQYV